MGKTLWLPKLTFCVNTYFVRPNVKILNVNQGWICLVYSKAQNTNDFAWDHAATTENWSRMYPNFSLFSAQGHDPRVRDQALHRIKLCTEHGACLKCSPSPSLTLKCFKNFLIKKITNVGEDMETSEPLCIACGNLKSCSCGAEHFGSSSKS